jgi:hypothetical protein
MLRTLVKVVVAVAGLAAIGCARAQPSEHAGEPAARTQLSDAGAAPQPSAPPPPMSVPERAQEEEEPEDIPYLDPSQDPNVFMKAAPGPRCSSGLTSCLPIPYNGDPQLRVGDLETPYHHRARRHPVREFSTTDSTDRCKQDGDCVLGGCGNDCVGWKGPSEAGVCVHYKKLTEAYCGCVTGFCGWFTQRRKAWRFSMGAPSTRAWPKGTPALTRAAYAEAIDLDPGRLTACLAERHRLSRARFRVVSNLDASGKTKSTSVVGLPDDASACVQDTVRDAQFGVAPVPPAASPARITVSSTWTARPVWVD